MTTQIEANFLGIFKIGDNIQYNLDALELLYDLYNDVDKQLYLRKLIIVQIGSLLDAVLYDFFFRAVNHTIEGIDNVPQDLIDEIQDNPRRADKLDKYIRFSQDHGVFDGLGPDIYDEMNELRKLRNRIHIQNERRDFEADDSEAFSERRKELAERVLSGVMQTLSDNHARHVENHNGIFVLPW
ncbi:hypothetical protein [Kordiimonas laminariae]|uniref:hypothetical protein n=1 Tax=Kordiimonas laminariae TaxID=2917717 RepID=UPI001FF2F426|nr:hypothetical protein [Kordiimonas laminariae]MCK0070858.1 hypothetical protein [Kordiimonas laminariae]